MHRSGQNMTGKETSRAPAPVFAESEEAPVRFAALERRARVWDRLVMIAAAVVLAVPLPFVRFESWPAGRLILERPVLPWSSFRICYRTLPEGEPVEEWYRFDWKGRMTPSLHGPLPLLVVSGAGVPLLRWQSQPDIPLDAVFHAGEFLKVETGWQSAILWPLRTLWSGWKNQDFPPQKGGAG